MPRIFFAAFASLLAATAMLPSTASAQVNREIWFSSRCPSPVRLFVNHQHSSGDWASHGWFEASANQDLTMLTYANGNPLQHIEGRPLYFYAEATDGSGRLWEGEFSADLDGIRYSLQQAILSMSGGRLQFGINCDNDVARAPAPAPSGATYGTVTLRVGFTPDPHVVALQAGGSDNASRFGSNCLGFVAQRPDVRLVYTAGSLPLIISSGASADTTLVVRGPGGAVYCDDDGGEGLNASVRLDRPRSGTYDIWVGTYSSGSLEPARLNIPELESQ